VGAARSDRADACAPAVAGAAASFFDEVDAEAAAYADDVRVRTNELGGLEASDMFAYAQ
jgi:hypothetical protein